ncbi:hypothetical protein [Variovorax sp. J31P207]|uniref:hypothetical protein n=1 Tax=Variovorax sp. J31P207 TaxID=3053510 RepID=UPI002576CEB7|nr:hypothetical protein [Variovorax sp. J31P207]MDM0071649.1 hypothetical protein [Variovorax sp. J31P207]
MANGQGQESVEPTIGLDRVRSALAIQWLVASAIIMLLLVLQSLLGRYGTHVQDAWSWILPNLMPTLGMMLTVLGYTALDPSSLKSVVRRTFFRIAYCLSILYFVLILLTILIQPVVAADSEKAIELMRTSNLWLGPLQGLVVSALGVLFVSKKPVTR